MDVFYQRLNQLARTLAAESQAISLLTAEDLVCEIARSLDLVMPAHDVERYAHELQRLIVDRWDLAGKSITQTR